MGVTSPRWECSSVLRQQRVYFLSLGDARLSLQIAPHPNTKNVLVSEVKNIEIERLVKKKKASSKEEKVRFEKIVKFISPGWMKEQLLEFTAGVQCCSSVLQLVQLGSGQFAG